MNPADSDPSDPSDRRPERAPDAPSTMSVDQLTHALAQLMGDEPAAGDQATSFDSAGDTQGGPHAAAKPSSSNDAIHQDEGENVTPASIIEALLFVGHPQDQPLTNRQMASYLRDISPQEVDALIEQLNDQYAKQKAAYRIVSVGAGYRMALHGEFAGLRASFYGRVREARLSQAAVDLLAIVAYHQPISRDEIDRLRDQASGGTLTQLVRRQLLAVSHTTERPRTKIYRTTDRFLDLFGLESLEDLPSHEDL
jgi:segregation and condensation protein B